MSSIIYGGHDPLILDSDNCGWQTGGCLVRCGWCGHGNTHFVRTEVYMNLCAAFQKDYFRIDAADDGNPSPERCGLRLLYRCEVCPGISALEIIEHKGDTILRVGRVSPEDFEPRIR